MSYKAALFAAPLRGFVVFYSNHVASSNIDIKNIHANILMDFLSDHSKFGMALFFIYLALVFDTAVRQPVL